MGCTNDIRRGWGRRAEAAELSHASRLCYIATCFGHVFVLKHESRINMKTNAHLSLTAAVGLILSLTPVAVSLDEPSGLRRAFVDGTGPDWKVLGEEDFVNVNCDPDTWTWQDGVAHCTGSPTGVTRTNRIYTNFELVLQWRHLRAAGNSGVFVWVIPESLEGLKPDRLPHGIEVQALDPGYTEQYEKKTGKKPDWFTAHGDVFAVGKAKMNPFPPLSANGTRSFPTKELTKGVGEWNHYYVRAINGEVRLWVNGEEVSGGNGCDPSSGYLALESEGSPVEFRQIRIRELP